MNMDFIKTLDKRKVIGAIIVLILIIALPITILTVRNQQNISSQAGNPVIVELSPDSKSFNVGETTDVQVVLKAGTISVQTVEFTLSFGTVNATNAANADFIPNANSGFNALYTPAVEVNNSAKTLTYKTAVSVQTAPITGNITLGTLRLTGINPGTARVNFIGGSFNELSGELTPTFVNGKYEVTTPATATVVPATATGVPPTGVTVGTPTVSTSGATGVPKILSAIVNPKNNVVDVIYRWGTVNTTCASLPNTISGPMGLTGNVTISPNNTTTANANLTPNSIIYYCASIKYGNNQFKYGTGVLSFTNGKLPTAPVTIIPATVVPVTTIPATTAPVTTIPATNTATTIPVSIVVSPVVNEAAVNIAVKLPGIGTNNNGTSNLGENNNPRHERNFDVYLFSQANTEVKKIPTTFIYANGKYTGTTLIKDVPLNVPYVVKLRTDNSLLKNLGFITPDSGKTYSLDATAPDKRIAVGKLSSVNSSNALGIEDYQAFTNCLDGLPICTTEFKLRADLNDDGIINLKDRSILIRSFVNIQGD